MLKKQRQEFDIHGREVVRGSDILNVVPKKVIPSIESGCNDQGLIWTEILYDCTLFIDQTKHCTLIYSVGKWIFTGKLLLTFNLDSAHGYRVSFPKKWLHLDLYTKPSQGRL